MDLNQEFLLEIFYSHCKRPTHKRYQNVFNAECPVCKEGKSAGRMRRLFYFPGKQYFYCHNCSRSWKPIEWVKEVAGLSLPEIIKRNKEKEHTDSKQDSFVLVKKKTEQLPKEVPDLPEDSIDLSDKSQIEFYKDKEIVNIALEYCEKRRLFTAVNSCKKFYVSLNDKIHKNRLIIPFFDNNRKVVCYQTRSLLQSQFPRYLTKYGEKGVFNFDNIDQNIPYVFIFEGPIDSMFIKNGVALAALSPTESQEALLNSLIGFQLIYVFDNDKNNPQTSKKIKKHIQSGKTVFVWPKEIQKYKDFNEVCCDLKMNEISWQFVANHSLKGFEALVKFKMFSAA